MLLVSFLILCRLAGMRSLGVPFCAPVAPLRPHDPDILLRLPLKWQGRRMLFARRGNWLRTRGKEEART